MELLSYTALLMARLSYTALSRRDAITVLASGFAGDARRINVIKVTSSDVREHPDATVIRLWKPV
jgi:hypothetical protein